MFARMAVAVCGTCAWCAEEAHTIPYVPTASSQGHAGFVRIESRSPRSGEVRVVAVDDAGQRVEAGRLTLGAGAAVEFEMAALESGDAALGLAGTGPGQGDWRLELTTELDIEARAYARSEDFVTALHDAVLLSGEVELPFFNPGGDARRSVLRLANARGEPATVRVRAVDDAGRAAGPVTAELGAWEARGYTASELESGSAAGLTGSLGDGDGRWRLTLSADRGSAYATNLLLDGSGVLSSVPGVMSRGGFHRVPLFPSASDGVGRRGLVRVVNRSADSAEVSIEAFDATDRAYEELRLALEAESSAEFDATDLEQGNAEKGLTGTTGPGEGDWWLELTSASDIEVLSYVDTASGPLSALRGTAGVETATGMRYEAVLLSGEASEVRLLNAGGEMVEVRVSGTDDGGAPGGPVEVTLEPWVARTLAWGMLSEGEGGLRGALGSGTGSWRLSLESDGEIDVLSLVRGAGGMLSDVSRRGRPAGAPPRTDVIDATAAGADLVAAVGAPAGALAPGEVFTLRATVRNAGGVAAPATTLRYYRSSDAAITTADTEVETTAVAALARAGAVATSLALNAPSEPGTYYYGACVDAVPEETNTANNCSAAVAVTVEARPDLAVAVAVPDGEVAPGGSFELRATVRNVGDAASSSTTLRYYRSSDASISTWDAEVGTDAVGALAAGADGAGSLTLNAPTTRGTYYYGACADAVPEESDTSNNCSAAIAVTVEARPDLAVAVAVAVPDGEVAPGGSFELRATVRNVGDAASSSTTLRYYRSSDASISTWDAEVGTDAVGALAAGADGAGSLTLNAPTTPGTYYYGACADAVADESDTSNNCSAAAMVTVRVPPDLAVTATLSESAVEPEESFRLAARVSNQGRGDAPATTLRYYRSEDGTIAPSDTGLGADGVAALAAGGFETLSRELAAPSEPGTYYYGACADAVAEESDTSNNCSAAAMVTVRVPPDLAVTATLSESAVEPEESFRLAARVSNQGRGDAPATTLRYYRSEDGTIAPSDTGLGADGVAALAAGGFETLSRELAAPSEPGTYYYGACADAVAEESDTSNNCSAAAMVTVRVPPDLAVTATLSESAVEPEESFRLAARVSNQGRGDAPATMLRYYRSEDGTIAPSDTGLGADGVAALAAGGFETLSRELAAPSEPGTYYYGACADAVAEESDTSNNCSAAAMVTVRVPPDLAVTATLSESAVEPEESFRLAARVSNQGRGDAPATMLRYYRSEDGTIAPSDTGLGADGVAALAAGGFETLSRELAAPSEPGTYYYGACADAVADESDTSNNCSAAAMVTVRVPPDLAVTATLSESAVEPEESFRLAARVSNQGRGDAPATTLRYYRSEDGTIAPSDTGLGADGVAALAAGGSETLSRELAAPSEPGTYYYGACADAVADESDTSNNCSAAAMVTVRVPPDLAVTATLSESAVEPEESFGLAARVSNQGRGDAPATMLRYYRSEDGTIAPSDTGLGADGVAALAAGGSETLSRELAAPSEPGTYYYGACADAVVDESDTSNNCSAAAMVTVRVPPDLAVTATLSESAVEPEESFGLAARVSNQGRGDAPATTLRYYRSSDASISTSDAEVGTDAVGALAAGADGAGSLTLNAPTTPGTYYYGACADAVADETNTANNCSAAVALTVREPPRRPDLAVAATLSESAVEPEESFRLAARVSNQGRGDAPATMLRYYRSSDASISTSDAEEGTDAVGALAAGSDGAGSLTLNAPTTPGTYYYGACVDAVADETNTANNCSAAVALTVREPPPGPDLVVTATLSDAVVDPGETFSLETAVRNRGGAASAATTLRYYRSSDASIATSDAEVGTDAVGALAAGADGAGSLTLNAPTTPGTYYYGACADAVADESDTSNNCSSPATLDAQRPIGPNLIITVFSTYGGASCRRNSYRTEVRIQNDGTAHFYGFTTARYYRSIDPEDVSEDDELSNFRVGRLGTPKVRADRNSGLASWRAFGRCWPKPSEPGTYYHSFCLDPVPDELNTEDNCTDPPIVVRIDG